tara:strand:+ start:53 stop:595 length:543 start_codon:yes stop_codon:yes gene_type:complete
MPNTKKTIAITVDHVEPELEKALISNMKSGTILIQVLRTLGKKWTDFISPNTKDSISTSTPEYYESIRQAIAKGFTSEERVLWETPTKELDKVQSHEKRELGQKIGSKIKDIRRQLKKEQEPKKDRAEPRSPLQLFWDHIHKAGDLLVSQPIFDDNNVRLKIEDAIQAIYDADPMNPLNK